MSTLANFVPFPKMKLRKAVMLCIDFYTNNSVSIHFNIVGQGKCDNKGPFKLKHTCSEAPVFTAD